MDANEIIKGIFANEKKSKLEAFRHQNKFVKKNQILFTGSSLMEQFPISEILSNHDMNITIYNRGIGGYTIPEMLSAIKEQILDLSPSKIFINIGTNDLSIEDMTIARLIDGYSNILRQIKTALPNTMVYIMAYYPVNVEVAKNQAWPDAEKSARLRLERLSESNAALEKMAKEFEYRYIDVNAGLTDENGQTKQEYSKDGIHMWSDAYEIVFENMKEYILE